MVLGVEAKVNFSINSIYECKNTEQLTKYFNAGLGSHPKTMLVAAEIEGFIRGFLGLTAKRISKHLGVEFSREAGHMRILPKSVRSATTNLREADQS